MDFKDQLFILTLITLYAFTFLIYAAVGNIIAGHKLKSAGDFFNPFTKSLKTYHGSRKKESLFIAAYYFLFLVLLIASSSKVMSLRSTFRAWVDRLMGTKEEEESVQSSPSTTSATKATPGTSSDVSLSASDTSLAVSPKGSKQRLRSKARRDKKDKKAKIPYVMRASVVENRTQIIPPLPRLSIKEDTADKLNRVISKLDSMDVEDETPPMKRKAE